MKTKQIEYSNIFGHISWLAQIPAGVQIFVNKLPKPWNVHVRIIQREPAWELSIWNAELPDRQYNPFMDDFFRLDWFLASFQSLEEIIQKLNYLNISIPKGTLNVKS